MTHEHDTEKSFNLISLNEVESLKITFLFGYGHLWFWVMIRFFLQNVFLQYSGHYDYSSAN